MQVIARTARRTDISLWDRVRLKHELMSRPKRVLRHFKRCQIQSLMELPCFLEIMTEKPSHAIQIALEAKIMGILIGDETEESEPIDQGDVLNSLKPGEV